MTTAEEMVFPGLPAAAEADSVSECPVATMEKDDMPQQNDNCNCCVDPTIAKAMDQAFANNHNESLTTRSFISEHSKLGFMNERQLISAKAAGQLDRDSLAKSRLDVASVHGPAAGA